MNGLSWSNRNPLNVVIVFQHRDPTSHADSEDFTSRFDSGGSLSNKANSEKSDKETSVLGSLNNDDGANKKSSW